MATPTETRATIDIRTPLESGDHLTREEFHRRYSAYPEIKKAELVEGVVYVGSPVRFGHHGQKHGLVLFWLYAYGATTPDVMIGDNSTVFLDGGNEVQPDAFLFHPEAGAARVTEEDYVEGAPQLVVEVAASSVSYDLHEKKEAYRRNGVREYIVWRVLDEEIDWFELRDGAYVRRKPDEHGVIESATFAGLRLHVPSLLAGDAAGLLAAVTVDQTR